MATYCGIDVGTQGVRAAVVDDVGAILGEGSAPLPASHRTDGRHEQDPDAWWTALTRATREACDAAGDGADELAGVALDATSGTLVIEDADGRPTGPALMYDDARAGAEAAVAAKAGAELWAALGYAMQPVWALPKVMWLLGHGYVPAGGRIVHQADHLVGRLTGARVATDTSTALKTGADLRDVIWPRALFDELSIPAGVLPDLVLPGTVLGRVSRAAADETGLPAHLPVRAGMTDGCAAQVAAGALRIGDGSSALGTTLVIKSTSADLLHDPSGAVYCHRHPDGGWLPGGASSSGTAIFADALHTDDFAALTEQARTLVPVAGVAYPLRGEGERFPFVAAQAHGFVPDTATDDPARFAALCQAIAYVERLAYDRLALLGGDVSGTVAFTGGAAGNRWWNQLRADVLGRTAVVPTSAQAAVGMAVLAAAPPGELTATAQRMVRLTDRFEPDASRHADFADGYRALVTDLADRGWLDTDVATAVIDRSRTQDAA